MSDVDAKSGLAQLSSVVTCHVDEVAETCPAPGSEGAVLLRALRKLLESIESSTSAKEIRYSVAALGRFAIDELDFDSPSGKRVTEILKLHQALIRAERRNG
jgi:hypothetical protein